MSRIFARVVFLTLAFLGMCSAQIFEHDWTYATSLPAKDSNWSSGITIRYTPKGEFAYSYRYANTAKRLVTAVVWLAEDGEVKWEIAATALDQYGRSGQSVSLIAMANDILIYSDRQADPNGTDDVKLIAVTIQDGEVTEQIVSTRATESLSMAPLGYPRGFFKHEYFESSNAFRVMRYSLTPPDPAHLAVSPTGVDMGNLVVSWETVTGERYQIQEAEQLNGQWENVGDPIVGTGATMNYSKPAVEASASSTYLRVLTLP